jgi:hypothetical protein
MIIDFSFEPGVAYWFKSVMRDGERFLAVAADREGEEVSFVKPSDLLTGVPRVIDGRETILVRDSSGAEFFASAAARENLAASGRVLSEIKRRRAVESEIRDC